ncbi:N-acetylmuramoyl-L-alanine amidase [Sporosarcina sp. E16_8]|uniref:N-acetylmuramoyl-L-alanine amidase n=1 Tax=Sporosarcina sp. E16_8 TaxID=2789295 RepID=UPI001A928F49|nr:N-acetylmuramoyl-L-alanine amidase [Sporosarcina sp. E16_8]MBO0588026.1 N-acetylmuramoyl-L-alanine amidase [Sporosarcina sp. E16_8]
MKTIKWAAVVMMIFTLISMVPGHSFAKTQFTDVTTDKEYFEEVNYIADLDIIKGYLVNGVSKFKPGNNLTRAQAAKMLVIAAKKQDIPTPSLQFTDVKSGTEQYKYVSRAVELGYFKADSKGSFKPNENLKRDEMGNALAVAFNLSEKISADKPMMFTDMEDKQYAERINGLYYAGVTKGDSGKFLPKAFLTRSQFSLFLARAMNDKYALPVKLPDQTSSTYFARVATSGETLNVRSLPSIDGDIIARLNNKDIVEVIGKTGDWLLILLDDDEGYINAKYTVEAGTETPDDNIVTPEKPTIPEEPSVTGNLIGKVTVKSLNMRQTASTNSPVIAALTLGQKVEVLSLDGSWAKIRANSKTGFVSKTYLKLLNQSGNPLKNRIIVIDAGHGAHDPGTSKNKVTEKAITLKVGKLVEAKLKNAGAKVVMTRSNDTYLSLEQRTNLAKNNFAETFVSIHVNSATSTSAKGTETYFDSSSNANSVESKSLATYIQNNIIKRANMVNRGVKDNRFYVIKNNNVAAVLVELAFLSNADDYKKLTSDAYLEIYADSIYQGLVQYYSAQ